MDYRWDEFEINYYYPVKVDRLFETWATGDGLRSFFIEDIQITDSQGKQKSNKQIIESDDSYSWKWRHNYSLSGNFKTIVKNEKVEFTFGAMLVSVRFKQLDGASLLCLKQTNIPTTDDGKIMSHMNCRICWTFFLTNLKSVYLNGTDLRDSDPQRVSSFEVGYQPKELS